MKSFLVEHMPARDAYGMRLKGFKYRTPMQTEGQVSAMLNANDCETVFLADMRVGDTETFYGRTREFVVTRTA